MESHRRWTGADPSRAADLSNGLTLSAPLFETAPPRESDTTVLNHPDRSKEPEPFHTTCERGKPVQPTRAFEREA